MLHAFEISLYVYIFSTFKRILLGWAQFGYLYFFCHWVVRLPFHLVFRWCQDLNAGLSPWRLPLGLPYYTWTTKMKTQMKQINQYLTAFKKWRNLQSCQNWKKFFVLQQNFINPRCQILFTYVCVTLYFGRAYLAYNNHYNHIKNAKKCVKYSIVKYKHVLNNTYKSVLIIWMVSTCWKCLFGNHISIFPSPKEMNLAIWDLSRESRV